MARMDKVGTHATTVTKKDGVITTSYHQTDVISIDTNKRQITLDSGGYDTATTKTRINQTINQYLGWECKAGVYQHKRVWYVIDGHGEKHFFEDGMTITY